MFSHLNLSNLCPFRKSHYHCQKLSWFSHHWDISEHNCRGQPLWPRWNHVIVDITSIQVTSPCKKKHHPVWTLTEDATKYCVQQHLQQVPSVLNHNPQLPHIFIVFEDCSFPSTFTTVSTDNYFYKYCHVGCLASVKHGNGETAISALSLRKKSIWIASTGFWEGERGI